MRNYNGSLYFVGLNSLQSGLHRQHMKDLFVELCLTVPVRLSSLLPYLPMLMDPLVSALNGSQTLVSQVQILDLFYRNNGKILLTVKQVGFGNSLHSVSDWENFVPM